MGIEGYLRRADAATIALIRKQAAEKNWTELERVQEETVEWMNPQLLNQEAAEDEDDEARDQCDEQYFPTVFYDWVQPSISEGAGLIDPRFYDEAASDTFMSRVPVFAFLFHIPPRSAGGIALADAGVRWVEDGRRDASLRAGIMADDTPKLLADRALELGLVERIGDQEGHALSLPAPATGESKQKKVAKEGSLFPDVVPSSILAQTQRARELIEAVTLRNDVSFFWNAEWPAAAEQQASASARSSSTTPAGTPAEAQPTLLGLPPAACAWIYTRLDCPSLCRMEILCKQSRASILRDPPEAPAAAAAEAAAQAPGSGRPKPPKTSEIDAKVLTPLGLLAWFVAHRRAWGNLYCSTSLEKLGYRKDAIRRHLRRRKIDQTLYCAGGLRLGAEWHAIHFSLGEEAGKLILDSPEANTGKEMGGSGIPILAHTPEEVEGICNALRARCFVDVQCECGQYGFGYDDDRCPYHPPWDGLGMWEYAEVMRQGGVMGPRDLEDFDIGFTIRTGLVGFLQATVKNKQGLIAYVW